MEPMTVEQALAVFSEQPTGQTEITPILEVDNGL